MEPDVRAKAEMLLKSGKMSPEDAAVLKAALQEGQPSGEDANEARAQRMDAAQHGFEQETSPGALAGHVAGSAWERLKGLGRGAKRLGLMALTPASSMHELAEQPAARREIGRGLSDTMFGLPAKLSDKLHGEPTYASTEEADAQDPAAQDYRAAGNIAGSAAPGAPVNLIGRGAMTLGARLGISPAIAALAASSVASGASAGLHADTQDRGGSALQAAGDPLNLLVPTAVKGMQKTGQGGRALASKFRDDTSALGGGADTLKSLDTMRTEGRLTGNLKRTVNDPELNKLPVGKKGYAKASQQARDTIGENTTGDRKAARASYDQEISAIEAEHADKAYPVESLKGRLNKLRGENNVNGEPVDDQLAAALDKVDRMTTKKTGILGREGGEIEASAATVSDLIKVKKAVGAKAQFGLPATPENRPYRLIWKELAAEAESIDPRIKPLNQKYAQSMGKLEETNDILYGKDAAEVADRPAAKKRAAGALMRAGDDTTAGTMAEESLDRLAELDPRNAKAIKVVKDKKAIERTRFGLPKMSKSPEKWGGVGALEQNIEAVRARVVDPLARALGAMGIDPATQAIIRARLASQQQEAK